jgi:hypothetical protein
MLGTSYPAHTSKCRRRPIANELAARIAKAGSKPPALEASDSVLPAEPGPDGGWHCPDCDHVATTKVKLQGHYVGAHRQKKVTCPKCKAEMPPGNFAQHVNACTGENIEYRKRQGKCPVCGKKMLVKSVKQHLEKYCPGVSHAEMPTPITPEDVEANYRKVVERREASVRAVPVLVPMTDDDLYAALEMIVGGNIPIRALETATQWVSLTRKLITLIDPE